MDHNAALGATSNFSDITKDGEWNKTKLWSDWDGWATEQLKGRTESTLRADKASKAQQRAGFGPLLQLDEATGLPIIPSIEELDRLERKTAQEWQQMVRQFLNDHHGMLRAVGQTGTNGPSLQLPPLTGRDGQCPGDAQNSLIGPCGYRATLGLSLSSLMIRPRFERRTAFSSFITGGSCSSGPRVPWRSSCWGGYLTKLKLTLTIQKASIQRRTMNISSGGRRTHRGEKRRDRMRPRDGKPRDGRPRDGERRDGTRRQNKKRAEAHNRFLGPLVHLAMQVSKLFSF